MKRIFLNRRAAGEQGFTLVELMVVIALLAILVALAVPVYSSSAGSARRNTCLSNQRAMESALPYWRYLRGDTPADESFVTGSCLPGDGEAFLDLGGNVPGDPSRSLATHFKNKGVFDCSANGKGVGQVGGCDYITDGVTVACLTDNQIALKTDGTPFVHDSPVSVGLRPRAGRPFLHRRHQGAIPRWQCGWLERDERNGLGIPRWHLRLLPRERR